MHCVLCDALLTDFEATRRNAVTGEFLDICNHCFKDFKEIIPTRDRKDLVNQSDFDLIDDEDQESGYNEQDNDRTL